MKLSNLFKPRRLYWEAQRRMLWARETWDAARAVATERGLSTIGVLREQAALYRKHDLDQYAYYWYRLYENRLPEEEKPLYLPDSVEANRRLWRLLTPDAYRCLYDNKLLFNRFFAPQGLPLAEIYGVLDPQVGFRSDGGALREAADLRSWLLKHGDRGFVFKPAEGIQGHRILVFVGRAPGSSDEVLTLAGERYSADQLVRFSADSSVLAEHNPGANLVPFLLEERIRPHPTLADFIGPTLCSVRVQTIIGQDAKPRIIAAVFKLQPGTAGVDQLVHGAVGCWVDLATGRLGRGRTRQSREDTSVIPGTDTSFVGFKLPDWDAVQDVALRAAAAFPWARAIGWDIGVSDRGPVLIEGNERWSPSLIQMPAPHGLRTGEFKALCDSLEAEAREGARAWTPR
jgi:Sugar-transfer associated ATP-grasp